MHPLFGFDIDDVCFHSFGVIAETLQEWYQREIKEPTSFDIHEQCPDIDPEDVFKAIDYALVQKMDQMEPVHGCVQFLRKYQELTGNRIIFITSRNPVRVEGLHEATYQLIQKWIPDLKYDIYFPKEEDKTKGDKCCELGVNVFVEDRVKYCVNCSDNGILALMMTRTWNKKFTDPCCSHRVVRVGNWYDVNLIFDSLYHTAR